MGIEEADNDNPLYESRKEKKQSLLQKYDIPIDHISYEYIGECKDAKELERIVRILRSGEEGAFPHLTSFAQDQLGRIKPESAVLLAWEPVRPRRLLEPAERRALDDELADWTREMGVRERDLGDEVRQAVGGETGLDSKELLLPRPAVRKIVEESKPSTTSAQPGNEKRAAGCDYAAWDKYDADTELSKIDLQDERRKIEARRMQELHRAERARTGKERIIAKSLLTGTELSVMSAHERDKGNEAYRVGDYEDALELYGTSVALDGDLDAYNNRAVTHIKLKNYEKAVQDCNEVLSADCENVKALLRRGLALEHLDKNIEALKDYEAVLKIDPEDKTALAAVIKLRKTDELKTVRLTIEEIYD